MLEKVNSPADLKSLSVAELETLADDIRAVLIKKVNETGGHMGPNLGFLEATIALHTVFDSPKDKIVFDVSHQCYTHKILTGRKEYFLDPAKYDGISGFTNPHESEHDFFQVGHTSTGASLAYGLAKARDLKGENYNVIAVVGDGSLTGGEALEALDNAAVLGSNMIIVVNDNDMSIAENHGGLYKHLKELRDTNGAAQTNFFKMLGFDYVFVKDGNDLPSLLSAFKSVKNSTRPVIVHLVTEKGHGLKQAVENKEAFHWITPHALDGVKAAETPANYTSDTVNYLLEKVKTDDKLIAVTAGTPGATGFLPDFRAKMGKHYLDVGICEPHAVAAISGMAKNGAHPVWCVLSSFIQRTYDQLSQDLALNSNPATILVFWGGISSADATHLGCFDIPLIGNIPNMVYLAPTNKAEYLKMLDWSIEQHDRPVAIRVPFASYEAGEHDTTDYSVLNKYETVEAGDTVALIGVGDFFGLAKKVKEMLKKDGINATLINPKFLTGLDTETLNGLKKNHRLTVTLENGVLDGGFGEKIARFYGTDAMKTLCFGADKAFTDRVPMNTLLTRFHLTPELIAADIKAALEKSQRKTD